MGRRKRHEKKTIKGKNLWGGGWRTEKYRGDHKERRGIRGARGVKAKAGGTPK